MNGNQMNGFEWPQPGDVEALLMRARRMRAAYFGAVFRTLGRRFNIPRPRPARLRTLSAGRAGHG